MSEWAIPLISAVLLFVGSVVAAWFTYLGVKRNTTAQLVTNEAQADASAAQEWFKLYSTIKEENEKLGERLDSLEEKLTKTDKLLDETSTLLEETVKRADASEKHNRLLTQELLRVYDWIEAGMVPPPPVRPEFLKGLMP